MVAVGDVLHTKTFIENPSARGRAASLPPVNAHDETTVKFPPFAVAKVTARVACVFFSAKITPAST